MGTMPSIPPAEGILGMRVQINYFCKFLMSDIENSVSSILSYLDICNNY
ncbi:hypothetical protein M153_5870005142 [Pseudoloma neurophilia]|uniref:Uncharacterized protein n=1 Tax=Pseudoloma neurophilia TaxID=146866 RepID=A0A0R0LWQ1_9MICR|nr:hypothetical protein M153_5870005142 [Pseudoloma neurophilia]